MYMAFHQHAVLLLNLRHSVNRPNSTLGKSYRNSWTKRITPCFTAQGYACEAHHTQQSLEQVHSCIKWFQDTADCCWQQIRQLKAPCRLQGNLKAGTQKLSELELIHGACPLRTLSAFGWMADLCREPQSTLNEKRHRPSAQILQAITQTTYACRRRHTQNPIYNYLLPGTVPGYKLLQTAQEVGG